MYSRSGDTKVPALPTIPAGQEEAYRYGSGEVLLVRSIVFKGKPTGMIYIQSDSQRLNARLRLYVGISGVVLAASLLAALLVSSGFRRAVAEPIVHLADVARAVSRDKDYSVRAAPGIGRDELSELIASFNDMLSQIQERDAALLQTHNELEQRVEERTNELATMNKELESFSYSVSHDLRAPLRSIDGFSQALLEDYGDKLDPEAQNHLHRVRRAAQHMAALIDDMLNLSRVTRSQILRETLDLSGIAKSIASELHEADPARNVEFIIEDGLVAMGDSHLMHAALVNLFGNAWKYTSSHPHATIEFGKSKQNGKNPFFVRDDGAGFDPRHAGRLFGVFQRLHTAAEFPGTGVGLATVQRIIHRHGGEVWAEGEVEKGATFYFTL